MSEQQQGNTSLVSSEAIVWWIRGCRWLLRVLLYVWGTLIANIVIGTVANVNTTTTDTSLSHLFIIYLAQTFPIPVFSSLVILVLLTLFSWVGSHKHDLTIQRTISQQDHAHLLRRLRLRYEQMLMQSLQGAVQIKLGLASRPAAIQNAASLSLRLQEQPEQLFPPHTSIIDAYELAQQELLILGEPGAGKSTLLLELAHHLVEQAEQNTMQPLPVLVPLSSWAVKRLPVQEWLIEQFALLYDVPRKLSKQWIQAELVLPLLDGLDEMEEGVRSACIAAINTYHREHLGPLVVCSRITEHDRAATSERLVLHSAVIVQPLSITQVNTQLVALGKPLAGLRAALKKNAALTELATTPLMLQLTYQGTTVKALSNKGSLRQQHIWSDYVQRMVSRKGDAKRYPLQVTTSRLTKLASHMHQHNLTIFYLEQLQPDWLPQNQQRLYLWNMKLLGVLLILLLGGLFGVLLIWRLGELFGGLLGWLLILTPRELIERSNTPFVVQLFFPPAAIPPIHISSIWLPYIPLIFLLIWLLGRRLLVKQDDSIQPAEVITWSHKKVMKMLSYALLGVLFISLLYSLFYSLLYSLLGGPQAKLPGMVLILLLGVLLGKLFEELSVEQLTERVHLSPNEGIKRSAKNGLFIGLLVGLLIGLLIGPLGWLLWPFVGLSFGLNAAFEHYILRFWLAHSGILPWKAVSFLEDATARILLRRVGGGYSFTHRLLLEYFADLDLTTPSAPSPSTSSTHQTPPQ